MTANIRIGSLDFDDIKTSIKNYIKNTSEFSDYNFEGSGISQLINILAYNSHYDALAANFLANEMFLDTAVNRGSIVSRAKELGYVPRSKRAARTTLSIAFKNVPSAPPEIVLPQGSSFSTSIIDETFNFVTLTAKSFPKTIESGQPVYRANVDVYEGLIVQQYELFDDASGVIQINNRDLDTTTLRVEVLVDNEWEEFSLPSSFLTVTNTSNIYMIQEGFSGYEIYFGDGVLGKRPVHQTDVRLTYVVTSGARANDAINFTLESGVTDVGVGTIIEIAANRITSGGLDAESLEEVRMNSTLQYGVQNRAVTVGDYIALARANFTEIKDCLAWDGAENVPPKFDKVVLCVQPSIGDTLTTSQKSNIAAFLQTKSIANTKIDFVDPTYVDVIVYTTAKYDPNLINIGLIEMAYIIKSAIFDYASTNIQKFGSKLRYSNLVRAIDDSHFAVKSNLTSVKMLKEIVPNVYTTNNISFGYGNSVVPGTLNSSNFRMYGLSQSMNMKDNGSGGINIGYTSGGSYMIHQSNVGTINYNTGDIQINQFEITSVDGSILKFFAAPARQDLNSEKNIILNLNMENIFVDLKSDTQK